MWFVAIGVAMLAMFLGGIGPVGAWVWADRWWLLLLPFGLAIAWWGWSDMSGLTQRRAMDRVDAKKAARRQKNLDALGLKDPAKRRR